MKFFKSSLILFSIVVILSGCGSTDQAKNKDAMNDKAKKIRAKLGKFSDKEKLEAQKFAESHADNYYKALTKKDYDAFCKSKKMSKKRFNTWHKSITKVYGTLESQNYVGSISNPLVVRYMWKWKFSKKSKGKTFTREALYNVFIAKDKQTNKYILFTTGLQ